MSVELDCTNSEKRALKEKFTPTAYAQAKKDPAKRWLKFGDVDNDDIEACPPDMKVGDDVCVTGGKFSGCQGKVKAWSDAMQRKKIPKAQVRTIPSSSLFALN